MYSDLKHKETFKSSIAIQNMKYPKYISPPKTHQPSEPSLTGKLQEVPPDILGIQPHPMQVRNHHNIIFDMNGNCNNMI